MWNFCNKKKKTTHFFFFQLKLKIGMSAAVDKASGFWYKLVNPVWVLLTSVERNSTLIWRDLLRIEIEGEQWINNSVIYSNRVCSVGREKIENKNNKNWIETKWIDKRKTLWQRWHFRLNSQRNEQTKSNWPRLQFMWNWGKSMI